MAKKKKKAADRLRTLKGGIKPTKSVAAAALGSDRDVTDVDDCDLGRYIKQTVGESGRTCLVYPAGGRIMLSVQS